MKHLCVVCENKLADHIHAGICESCYTQLSVDLQSINTLIQYYRVILIHKKILAKQYSFDNVFDFLKFVSEIILTYFNYDRTSIYIHNPSDNTLKCKYVSGLSEKEYHDQPGITIKKSDNIDTSSVACNCFLTKQPIIITDRSNDPSYQEYLRKKENNENILPRSRAFAMVPLISEEKSIGVLGVFRLDAPDYYPITQNELSTLIMLSDQIATVIQNILIFEEQVYTQKDFAAFITNLIEKEEEYSPGHHLRVANITQEISKAMGLSNEQIMDNYLAATIHDFGKTDYSRLVLRPGKLTKKEKKELQNHTMVDGKLFISASVFKERLLPLISQHHERWDGGGYPFHLKGENIALGARIISVADAYDAMVSDRPYRKGMSHEDAIKELKNNAGSQFDPQIVDVFEKMYEAKRQEEQIL